MLHTFINRPWCKTSRKSRYGERHRGHHGLNAIAGELLPHGDVFESLSWRILQLAEDIDFEGILSRAAALVNPGGAPQ
jgi:hypothetical protein